MMEESEIRDLFQRRKVLICVGAGGVGKTTVAAALALAAAQSGQRTLCLTVDPSRRLASSLGLNSFPREELRVSREFLASHGVELRASLTVMMLDAQGTFDSVIRKFSRTEESASRIIRHRVYRHLSKNLAGTQAYMAMEKVLEVMADERYDLIVLDTPPSARALAFFDAPRKMTEILVSPITRLLGRVMGERERDQRGIVAAALRRAMEAMERVAGAGFILEIAELVSSMGGLLDGFARRADKVEEVMRSQSLGYLLVTTSQEATLDDARALAQSMKSRLLELDAVVFNQIASVGVDDANLADVTAMQEAADIELSPAALQAVVDMSRRDAQRRNEQQARCEAFLKEMKEGLAHTALPAFAEEVHDPASLMRIAGYL